MKFLPSFVGGIEEIAALLPRCVADEAHEPLSFSPSSLHPDGQDKATRASSLFDVRADKAARTLSPPLLLEQAKPDRREPSLLRAQKGEKESFRLFFPLSLTLVLRWRKEEERDGGRFFFLERS